MNLCKISTSGPATRRLDRFGLLGELMSQKSNFEAAERLGLLGYGLSDDEATRPGPGRTVTARRHDGACKRRLDFIQKTWIG